MPSSKPRKSKKYHRWGLFNYNTLYSVWWTRKAAHAEGAEIFIGGAPAFRKALKEGSMRISKVTVEEGWK